MELLQAMPVVSLNQTQQWFYNRTLHNTASIIEHHYTDWASLWDYIMLLLSYIVGDARTDPVLIKAQMTTGMQRSMIK